VSASCAKELALLVRSGWRLIALETFEEMRALRLLEQVAKSCERELLSFSIASGLSGQGGEPSSFDEGLRAMASHPRPALFAVLDAHRVLDDAVSLRRLRDLLGPLSERSQTLVLVGPTVDVPLELERETRHVELPLPRRDELEALFGRSVESPDPAALAAAANAALGLTGSEAVRVFRKACTSAGGLSDAAVAEIVREKRQALRRTPALEFCETAEQLGDVGGLGELKRWLADRRRAFSEEARRFGLPVPRGLLLLGVQGCGKSLCAKAVAREWQFPLLRLDIAEAFSRTEKSPEATIREATALAESLSPAVLWIDEIEKGFSAASSDTTSSRVFGSFLIWLAEKQSPVFVVATANDVQSLPPELLRRGRFDELFFVDLPTQAERIEIFAIHLRKRGRDPKQFALDDLAGQAERLSGAEIEQVVASSLYTAFAESRELADNDLANAITDTVPLYDTFEKRIKELRDWARHRARPATIDVKLVDLFQTQRSARGAA
jgi:SpoVK/Ycf46/Vps4 family AAA+-type ATPase